MALKETVVLKCEIHTPTEIVKNEDGTLSAIFKIGSGGGLTIKFDTGEISSGLMMIPYETATNGEGPFLLLPIEKVKET